MHKLSTAALLVFLLPLLLVGCELLDPGLYDGSKADPKKARIKYANAQWLSCPICEPSLMMYVTLEGDFAGGVLWLDGASSDEEPLHLPDDPVAASPWTSDMPKIVYTFYAIDDPTFDVVLRGKDGRFLDRKAVDATR